MDSDWLTQIIATKMKWKKADYETHYTDFVQISAKVMVQLIYLSVLYDFELCILTTHTPPCGQYSVILYCLLLKQGLCRESLYSNYMNGV